MEFTRGTIIFLGSAGSFAAILIFWISYMAVTARKMKKLLNEVEKDEEDN